MKHFFIAGVLVLLTACSIQSRKYQKGYYVKWHTNLAQSKKDRAGQHGCADYPAVHHSQTPGTNKTEKQNTVGAGQIQITPGDNLAVLATAASPEHGVAGPETTLSKPVNLFSARKNFDKLKDPEKPKKKKNHPLAHASLYTGILSMVFLPMLILEYDYGHFQSSTAPFLIFPLVTAVVAVITGKLASRKIKAQPEKFKGKGMYIPGMILGLVFLFFVILTFTAVIL